MPTLSGCYARGKEYGLNKRLDEILFNTVMAIQEIPDVHSKGGYSKKDVTTEDTIPVIAIL